MAQVAFEKNIGSEWVDVTTLATLTADEVYYIQNRGAGVLIAQENNIEPTDEAGTVVVPYKVLKYTNNGKLWVKSLSGLCTINITDKNAPAPLVEKWYNLMGFSISERGMVMSVKPYTSEWQPLKDMTELQAYMAESGGKFSGAGYAYKNRDDLTFDKAFVGNNIISPEPEYLDGEASLWIVVTENNEKTKILFTDATATFSEDFMTMNWSYGTYAGTFTYDMSDMNKPLLKCIHVIHNGQACENAELMVKFISAPEQEEILLDMSSGFVCGDPDPETETTQLTKTVDGYNVVIDFVCGDSVALTPTVTKDGTSAGTATTWLVITKDGEEVKSFNFTNLICEATSERSFEFQTNEDSSIGYFGSLSVETDAEEGTSLFVMMQFISYNGVEDADLTAEIKVKVEPSEE